MGRLGFDGGRVLEPGSGAGTLIGLAPTGVQMTGVELDPLTAAMSHGLYPQAEVRTESFALAPGCRARPSTLRSETFPSPTSYCTIP
ncbi:hypothetical protein [uncultured Microbacterium sp.]|uniref:hypothetical protein n=1 Tax=uncultured Microbacterium sp. TaxID=191216 RepID=UPI0028D19E5F|nr:hypothetical protein [uncultured Microbacterium sp.]